MCIKYLAWYSVDVFIKLGKQLQGKIGICLMVPRCCVFNSTFFALSLLLLRAQLFKLAVWQV